MEKFETAVAHSQLHFNAVHGQPGQQPKQQGRPNKIDTPRLKLGSGPDEFSFWREKWQTYKRVARLNDAQDIRDQLVNCCEDDLHRDLHNSLGTSLQTKTE